MEWKKSNIKHSTLANSYEDVGLEDTDIFAKVISLQCSWMKKLFDKNFVTNFILVLLHDNGKTKSCNYFKLEYKLESKLKYCWLQLTHALTKLSQCLIRA